jgi:hypothetical protein
LTTEQRAALKPAFEKIESGYRELDEGLAALRRVPDAISERRCRAIRSDSALRIRLSWMNVETVVAQAMTRPPLVS